MKPLSLILVLLLAGCSAPLHYTADTELVGEEIVVDGITYGYYEITFNRWDGSITGYRYIKTVDGKRYLISEEEYLTWKRQR